MYEQAERRTVTLYPRDWAIVLEADKSSAGVSATLRRIIREWAARQPHPADSDGRRQEGVE
jgi:hypothetical protein